MASSLITLWHTDGETMETVTGFIFLGSKSLQMVTVAIKWKDTCSLEEKLDKPRWHIKTQRYHFANKGLCSPSYGFSSGHVWMWQLDHKEGWVLNNSWLWTVVLERTLESPLDIKEIKPVNPKGNQPWIFIGRTDAEVEAPVFGHLMWKGNSLEKTLMLGKTEGKTRRGQNRMRWLDGITD